MTRKYVALIIDDDPAIIALLTHFLALTNLFEVPHHATNSVQALLTLQKESVDLIFLDMKLDEMTGLELLRLIPNPPPVIAISSYTGFAVDCYESGVVDFLPKPLNYTRFLGSIQKTLLRSIPTQRVEAPGLIPDYLPQAIQQPVAKAIDLSLPVPFIYLKTGRKTERFAIDIILYFHAYGMYTKLITKSGTFVVNEYLGSLEKGLNPNQFIRVHKSYIVNISQITKFNTKIMWLENLKLPIGIRYKANVLDYLKGMTIN